MRRISSRFAVLATLAFAGAAFGQVSGPPPGVPNAPSGAVPPGGPTESVTGREATIAEQVDEMNRHINGDRVRPRNSSAAVDRPRAATAAEVIAGAAVSDSAGVQLGTIESVDAGGAVIPPPRAARASRSTPSAGTEAACCCRPARPSSKPPSPAPTRPRAEPPGASSCAEGLRARASAGTPCRRRGELLR